MISKGKKFYLYRRSMVLATIIAVVPSLTGLVGTLPAHSEEGGQQIDIRAEQQEFAEGHVIATGKVRVDHGDTIIQGPKATLYRDDSGAASSAVFTGNPHLVQGKNKIRANKLTFNVKTSSILAVGNAHSEVYTDDSDTPASDSSSDKSKEGREKIITDSDRQEYERESGKFEAHGNVRVKTGNIKVRSNHMKIVYGTNKKAEAAIFTGHAEARQDKNITQADKITYFLTTQRLQATGNVRSKVIEEKSDVGSADSTTKTATKESGGYVATGMSGIKVSNQSSNASSNRGMKDDGKIKFFNFGDNDSVDAPVYIVSDSQDYNKQSNRMDAVGNVKLFYKDTKGRGPRVALIRNKYGKAERVIFTGRSQITQPGRKWIGDRITLTLHDRKVLAEGNTKAIIVQDDPTQQNRNRTARKRNTQSVPMPNFGRRQSGSQLAGTNNQLR